eukprot:3836052-Pleurochrysis_carterae.AAC.1
MRVMLSDAFRITRAFRVRLRPSFPSSARQHQTPRHDRARGRDREGGRKGRSRMGHHCGLASALTVGQRRSSVWGGRAHSQQVASRSGLSTSIRRTHRRLPRPPANSSAAECDAWPLLPPSLRAPPFEKAKRVCSLPLAVPRRSSGNSDKVSSACVACAAPSRCACKSASTAASLLAIVAAAALSCCAKAAERADSACTLRCAAAAAAAAAVAPVSASASASASVCACARCLASRGAHSADTRSASDASTLWSTLPTSSRPVAGAARS